MFVLNFIPYLPSYVQKALIDKTIWHFGNLWEIGRLAFLDKTVSFFLFCSPKLNSHQHEYYIKTKHKFFNHKPTKIPRHRWTAKCLQFIKVRWGSVRKRKSGFAALGKLEEISLEIVCAKSWNCWQSGWKYSNSLCELYVLAQNQNKCPGWYISS